MPRNTSVTIDDRFAQFMGDQLSSGRYASERDVVHAGLKLLEEQEAKLRALGAALDEGERSGPAAPFDFDAFRAEMRAAHRAE